jgi:SAM-dependent methyltransferase
MLKVLRLFDRQRAEPVESNAALRLAIPVVDSLSSDDLQTLNRILPWNCFVCDSQGRRFGSAFSSVKRNQSQAVPDSRIVEFDRRYHLRGHRVLEVGCFEGIHTIALAQIGAVVTAVDSRIEHVCKTLVRCGLFHVPVTVHVWDVEQPPPPTLSLDHHFLCHIGVLYHLLDPVSHLMQLLPSVQNGVLLDTHVAPENASLMSYDVEGKRYSYYRFRESGRKAPFAGMYDHAKWLPTQQLLEIFYINGFDAEIVERRDERNGPRVLIHAARNKT